MSITITGILGLVISQFLGDQVSNEEIAGFLNVGGLIIFAGIAWFGRWRHGDINIFGAKK